MAFVVYAAWYDKIPGNLEGFGFSCARQVRDARARAGGGVAPAAHRREQARRQRREGEQKKKVKAAAGGGGCGGGGGSGYAGRGLLNLVRCHVRRTVRCLR